MWRAVSDLLSLIQVHARDVIDNLCKIGLSDTHDFEWISQLRYYWNNEEYCRKRSKLPLFYRLEDGWMDGCMHSMDR